MISIGGIYLKKNTLLEQLNQTDDFLKVLEEKVALSREEVKMALKNKEELTEMIKINKED